MSHKTKLMFFFDTEDFTAPESADAILELATILTQNGIRGHFAVVGLLARQLAAWGRFDVIEALKKHEIGSHTYGHSLHPDICEQTDCKDFDTAYLTAAKSECEGLGMLHAVFDRDRCLFAVPPGDSKSYVAMYLYADLGIPFYCDTVIVDEKCSAINYCNARHIAYTDAVESIAFGQPRRELSDILDGFEKKDYVIVYTHPNMAEHLQFWDGVNYMRENKHAWGEWEMCPRRTAEETARYYATFRSLIRTVKSDNRFEITDLRTLEENERPRKDVTPALLPVMREALSRELAPLDTPSLSVADMFLACVSFLRGADRYTPEKVYGFLEPPYAVTEDVTVRAEDVRTAAREIDVTRFLPVRIRAGVHDLGPADFLYAMLDTLTGAQNVTVTPRVQMNSIAAFPKLERFAVRGTWVHTPALRDDYLSDRLRLQAWTLRYSESMTAQ
ncbi:MAG: hypothetical protein ACOXZM_05695 [Eubacteriales bacterium]